MEGEDENSDDERAFGNKKVWQRMLIVVAGAVMNILFGLVLMMITLAPNKYFASTTIAVFADNATSSQQLQVGDDIRSINGYKIDTITDLSFALATSKSNKLDMTVSRNGEIKNYTGVTLPTVKKNTCFRIAEMKN